MADHHRLGTVTSYYKEEQFVCLLDKTTFFFFSFSLALLRQSEQSARRTEQPSHHSVRHQIWKSCDVVIQSLMMQRKIFRTWLDVVPDPETKQGVISLLLNMPLWSSGWCWLFSPVYSAALPPVVWSLLDLFLSCDPPSGPSMRPCVGFSVSGG